MRSAPLFVTLGPLVLLLACEPEDKAGGGDVGEVDGQATDDDGDGYFEDDCADGDATVHPGAVEVCDGVDNNCDGVVDEDVTSTFYTDGDGDGFGDPDAPVEACEAPAGTVPTASDCDDTDPDVFPAAEEVCDHVDNDCDALIDEDVTLVFWADQDGDGFGDPAVQTEACELPADHVDNAFDCDDTRAEVNPDHAEVCDELDNNCNEVVDEGVTTTFYIDLDSDGWGDTSTVTEACSVPGGYSALPGDCDDALPDVNPDATEVCNDIDDDCDSTIDESDAIDASVWYGDTDSDGYGDAWNMQTACDAPTGFVANATDCDDGSAAVNPAATEVCNSIDDDCDTLIDDADSSVDTSTGSTFYADDDGDGYGDAADTTDSCSVPSGHVANDADCDDGSADVNPAATEVCNSIDDDCDTYIDDDDSSVDTSTGSTFYADDDGDGYGDATDTEAACTVPTGHVSDDTDCDDGSGAVNPGATEVCNSIDDDCDGDIDDDDSSVDTSTGSTFYADDDADGYGDAASSVAACAEPSAYVSDDTDCDDTTASVNPGASEVCNGDDDDCDGDVDDGVLGSGAACAAESCAEIIADQPTASDGTYTLDPTGSGTTSSWLCDMTTDGGGWTRAIHWDREQDGDTITDFKTLFTADFDNMARWASGSTYIEWADYTGTADVMAYQTDVEIPNDGETILDLDYYGYSMEDSGTFFFIEDTVGTYSDIQCAEMDQNCSPSGTAHYTNAEMTWVPYTCANGDGGNYDWDTEYQDDHGTEVSAFHIRSMMCDVYGDWSRLYHVSLWVR